MKNTRWLFVGIVGLFVMHAQAQTVGILCPAATDLHFYLQHPGEKWHEYKDVGTMQIMTHNFPDYVMEGNGSSTTAEKMTGATWGEGVFICLYQGNKDDVLLMYNDFPFEFKHCGFKKGYSFDCSSSDPAACELVCQGNPSKKP